MSDCESIASERAAPLAVAKDLTSRVGADLIRLRRPAASLTWREPVIPTLPTGSSDGASRPLTFPSRLRDPVDFYGALFFLFFVPPFFFARWRNGAVAGAGAGAGARDEISTPPGTSQGC